MVVLLVYFSPHVYLEYRKTKYRKINILLSNYLVISD